MVITGKFYLVDLERTAKTGVTIYWKPNSRGYTGYREFAGKYDLETALWEVKRDVMFTTAMIPVPESEEVRYEL